MKIVVYTAIFGKYDGLIPQPKYTNVDYVCFTDQEFQSKIWEVRKVTPQFGDDQTRNNRYYKIRPHLHFPDHDVSIYIDGNFVLKRNPHHLLNKLKETNMLVFDHNQTTTDARKCVYKEYEALIELGKVEGQYKDDPEIMRKQIERFRAEGYPENNGLLFAAVLIRKHNADDVKAAMESWWKILMNESKRDQLSFNYVAWKNNFKYATLNGDLRRGNPWFHSIGIHRKNYRKKYLTYRLKRLFGGTFKV